MHKKRMIWTALLVGSCWLWPFLCNRGPTSAERPKKDLRVERLASARPNWFGMLYYHSPEDATKLRCVRFLWDDSWEVAEETQPGNCDKLLAKGRLIANDESFVAEGFPANELADGSPVWKVGSVNIWINDREITSRTPNRLAKPSSTEGERARGPAGAE
jgi:hypothetical protein